MKSKFLWGSAILCCALGLGTVSCSDDDDKEFSIDETFTTKGIETDYEGGIYKIQVKGNSEWEATSDARWVNVVVKHGKGGQEAVILVESTFDGISRNANIIIKSGSDQFQIPVNQIVSKDNATEGMEVVLSKGLGMGYDVSKLTYKPSCIINTAAIEAVMDWNSMRYGTLLKDNYRSELEAELVSTDSVESKHDSLGVQISCTIAYGTFKFGVSGKIHNGEDRKSDVDRFNFAANYPLYTGTVNLAGVMSAYNAWKRENCPEVDSKGAADYRGYLLEGDFIDKMEALEAACDEGKVNATNYKNYSKVVNLCQQIVSMYGPVTISKATIGGCYMLQADLDTTWTHENFAIDNATVTAAFKAGVFELDAKVSVTYEKIMTESLKHGTYNTLLKGGKLDDQVGVQNALYDGTCFTDKTSLKTWAKGLKIAKDKKNNAELIEVDLMGIWTLLGTNSQAVMKQYLADTPSMAKNELVRPLLISEGVIEEEVKKETTK